MSERQSIAEQLRNARQQQGLTIEDIQRKTGLTANLLDDLESNRFNLVEPVYTRMALRTYADHLGLNAEALVTQYNQERGLLVKTLKPRIRSYSDSTAASRQPSTSSAWRGIGLVLALVVAAIVLFLLFFGRDLLDNYRQTGQLQFPEIRWPGHFSDQQERPSETGMAVEQQSLVGEADASTRLPPPAIFTGAGGRLPAELPDQESVSELGAALDQAPLTLEVEAVENVWVEIRGDERLLFQGVIPQGTRQRWETDEAFLLWSGRPHGLRYWFQGELLNNQHLAGSGQVLRFAASREGIVLLDADFQPRSGTDRGRQP